MPTVTPATGLAALVSRPVMVTGVPASTRVLLTWAVSLVPAGSAAAGRALRVRTTAAAARPAANRAMKRLMVVLKGSRAPGAGAGAWAVGAAGTVVSARRRFSRGVQDPAVGASGCAGI